MTSFPFHDRREAGERLAAALMSYARRQDVLVFDAVLHFDETRALEPLERTADWEQGELPETFPFAV